MGPTEEIGCGVSVIEPGKVPNCWPQYTRRALNGKQFFVDPRDSFPGHIGDRPPIYVVAADAAPHGAF